MTLFIFAGDMLVMLFMICLVVWFVNSDNDENISYVSRVPLEDEDHHG